MIPQTNYQLQPGMNPATPQFAEAISQQHLQQLTPQYNQALEQLHQDYARRGLLTSGLEGHAMANLNQGFVNQASQGVNAVQTQPANEAEKNRQIELERKRKIEDLALMYANKMKDDLYAQAKARSDFNQTVQQGQGGGFGSMFGTVLAGAMNQKGNPNQAASNPNVDAQNAATAEAGRGYGWYGPAMGYSGGA